MVVKKYLENYQITELDQDVIAALVKEEEIKQRMRWGSQDISLFEWNAILGEEVGELAKAIMEHEYRGGSGSAIVHEAIQVAMIASKIARLASQYGRPDGAVKP